MANKNIKINLDYSEFSGGITECQRKMGLLTEQFKMQQSALGNNASEVDKLTLAQSTLQQKIDLQVQIVEKASEKFKALSESQDATSAQIDNAQKAYTKQITTLNELTNELEKVNDKLEEVKDEESNVSSSTEETSGSFQNLASSITAPVAVMASLVSAMQQTAQALGDIATKSTQLADDLATTAVQMGVTTTTLQELSYAAAFVDVSVETMQSSMSKLTKSMSDAQSGSATAQNAFRQLGVSIQEADGSLKSSEEVFYEVIDALGEIANPTERDAVAMQIFGKSAQELNSLIEAGSGSLQAYGAEAEALGIVLSESDVQALAEMQNSFDRLNSVMDAAQNKVSAAIAPAFAGIADVISNMDPAILAAIAGFGSLLGVVSSLAPTLQAVAAIAQLVTVSKTALTAATTAATIAETDFGFAALFAHAAMLPEIIVIGALATAIIMLVAEIREYLEVLQELETAQNAAAQSTRNFSDAASGSKSSEGSSTSGSKHYALGGRVSGNKVWVGEQGAELVELPTGSTVYNHQESSNMTSSSNVFNVTIDAKSVDDFNKVVNVFNGLSQSMNRGGRVNG